MGIVSLEAVDILFPLSIYIKLNDEVTSAWSTLGLCISCCYSLGLNRLQAPKVWAIYSYKKLFSFELGYASCIIDECYDKIEPTTSLRYSSR
ncbi:hypothetical protein AUP68_17028 [Ilyonectria robusta]